MRISVKFIWILILITPFLQGFGCGDDKLLLVNNSDDNIYVRWSCDGELAELNILRPDYFWIDNIGDTVYVEEQIIKKNSSDKLITRGSWRNNVRNCREERIFFFIFSESIVRNYSDDEIIAQALFQRFEFTLDELKKNNWVVSFP